MRLPPVFSGTRHFLGDPIRSRSVCGISMVDASYRAGLVLPVHTHQSAYLCRIRSGEYAEAYGMRNRECRASTVVFHPRANVTLNGWEEPMFSHLMSSLTPNG